MSRADELLDSLLRDAKDSPFPDQQGKTYLARLRQESDETQLSFVLQGVRAIAAYGRTGWGECEALKSICGSLLKRKLPWTPESIQELAETAAVASWHIPYSQILTLAVSVPMTEQLRFTLGRIDWALAGSHIGSYSDFGKIRERISGILGGGQVEPLRPKGPWSTHVLAEATTTGWRDVFCHARTLGASEPSRKWREQARDLRERVGVDSFRQSAMRWLALGPCVDEPAAVLRDAESELIRGFIWFLPDIADAALCAEIARFAEGCYKKIPQIGAVSHKAGNAAVNALAVVKGLEAVSQLSRLAQRIKYNMAQRLVEKALQGAAQRAGLSRDTLEDLAVPSFGLDSRGVIAQRFDSYSSELSIRGSSVDVVWWDSSGKPLKAAPAAVKSTHPETLKQWLRLKKEIEPSLNTQTSRVERLLLSQREMDLAHWQAHFLDHPLVGTIARRLIWQFDTELAIWRNGSLVHWNNPRFEPPVDARVKLWHPIGWDVQTVLSWRCWLEDHQVQQPFKQAHREVYVLTPAEETTGDYSNRFAAHILRQHQFNALCRERGWQYRLMGAFDSHNIPSLALPQYGTEAQFWVNDPGGNEDVSHHGIYLFIGTDQVRFVDRHQAPIPLREIPPVVFSEVMRDVDLFTGVASIGNDPAWQDGRHAEMDHYWNTFSFGELSIQAEGRRELLARLLPKLTIGDRCSLEARFVAVRGDRATYRIHLGSGNVLMEPGSRYLCVVPGGSGSKVFLPFEGDRMLSVILSKMFLLAADRKITDPAILKQLPE